MFEFIVLAPAAAGLDVAAAGSRAGALGVLDLAFAPEPELAPSLVTELAERGRRPCGVMVASETTLEAALMASPDRLGTIVACGIDPEQTGRLLARAQTAGRRALAVVSDVAAGRAAQAAGAAAVIAKGHEAGGFVGQEGAFVLMQRLLAELELPVFVQGGIGLHTAAGAYAAGAAGVVLGDQLLLTRESQLAPSARRTLERLDGSETATPGATLGRPFRIYHRPGLAFGASLFEAEGELIGQPDAPRQFAARVTAAMQAAAGEPDLHALGQDAAFAAPLARRFGTVGGILTGLRRSAETAVASLGHGNPLAAEAPLARAHGTRYPIVQGPMTRVSDQAGFAAAVAQAGALPFLALALMRAAEADALLEETRQRIGEAPWGVGVLGFVPAELREEQLTVVRAHQPPFALIAGGRPDQARALEADGITTYLHVPSPALLELYVADGARRFVFEGRECGGHVGPRTSFVLWETMLDTLLEALGSRASECQILLAGGVHDARSGAAAAATLAEATRRGVRAGVLLGTAYLFTREATATGAITPAFQDAAVAAADTVLLESGPGHATRCLASPFVDQFQAEKQRLRAAGTDSEQTRQALEQLNIGRLRIAAKGVDRNPEFEQDPTGPKLVEVAAEEQWEQGLYMIGQVAALRTEITSMAALHEDIAAGSSRRLEVLPRPPSEAPAPPAPADVAIVGVATIVPGAPDARMFWANILAKVDAIREVPRERFDADVLFDPDPSTPDKVYSRWGGFIDPVAFDPMAFGLPPNSLASIEPFQLLALLTARAALADAGYAERPFDRERTSVILGAGGGGGDLAVGYTVRSALPELLGSDDTGLQARLQEQLPEWTEDSFAGILMNVAAGRIANRLDFGGTNYTVDAACASSLAALGLATRELQYGTSDMVLAGGIDAIQNPFSYLCFSKTRALSPRGRCRPFDAGADGIAISEGFATVVLKRVTDAERDGDRIYAVIRGVGAASDGRDRSLTAPRPEGQMRALRRAYAQAGYSPATVELVEAHGTGTVAGDGAEVQALTAVFTEHDAPRQGCAIGSVKSMIGHTKATAGVAGLVKTALALHHRVLPPTINVSEPNPKAGFRESPFYVNSEARPWLTGTAGHPRRAGVSAFGFGGTDFHLALEEYQGALTPAEAAFDPWPAELLVWRGTREAIAASLAGLAAALASGAEPALADLAYTLLSDAPATGEATLAMAVESLSDLREQLARAMEMLAAPAPRTHSPQGIHFSSASLAAQGQVAFLFPGQGSQTVGMGRELLIGRPESREPLERADGLLADAYAQPLSRFVYPPPSFTPAEREAAQRELTDTHVAQAALGAIELGYLRVLERLGIRPEMTAGHSFGELVALAAAGALAEDDLLRLAETRGRLMREAAAGSSGAMAATDIGPEELAPLLERVDVTVANLNAPRQTVLSGTAEHIEAALRWCQEHGIGARRLPVACAFHSPQVAAAQERFAETLAGTRFHAPRFPVFSNTTGAAHASEPEGIAALLAEHLVRPVEFVREIEAMHEAGARIFVEVGPRAVLTGLTEQILGPREHLAVALDRSSRSGLTQFVHALAALASEGVPVRADELFAGRRVHRLDLRALNAAGPEPVKGAWFVDGGRVRPAHAAPERPRRSQPPTSPPDHIEQERQTVPIALHNGNGSAPVAGPPAPSRAISEPSGLPVARPPDVAVLPASPPMLPGADRTADVMAQYHAVMQRFLDAQRAVMLGYLGTRPVAGAEMALPLAVAPPAPPPPLPATAAPVPAAAAAAPAPMVTPAVVKVEVAPAVVAPAPPAPATGAGATLTPEEIERRLLDLVSQRTGYPTDMLALDADLEGDLGIDSIKRVEIAGTFTQTLAPEQRGAIEVEELTASRTLREVIALLQGALAPDAAPAGVGAAPPEETRPFDVVPAETERIGRYVVEFQSAPEPGPAAGLSRIGAVIVLDDGSGLAAPLAAALARDGHTALVVSRAHAPRDPHEVGELLQAIREEHRRVKAVVILGCRAPEAGDDAGLGPVLVLIQAVREDLEHTATHGGAAVLGATSLGGAHGLDGAHAPEAAPAGALGGFLKTLALELPEVRVKSVDLDASAAEVQAERLRAELLSADGLVEVGYRDGQRIRPALSPAPLAERAAQAVLTAESVVLATGGARGITAEVLERLAVRYRSTFVLVGRTELEPEPAYAQGLDEPAQLRAAIVAARRHAGEDVALSAVERECRQILSARAVRATLDRLRATGARVEYERCDAGDADALRAVVQGIYARHGRLDGVIHGAGIIEDRLIRDKELASLERVLRTKAGAAQTLCGTVRPEQLRFLVLFSSVSGRFGNRGQADYAAASETLGKLAQSLDRRWAARVVAVEWGPWRTKGMVSPELEREFARRGVSLIEVDAGCQALIDELERGRKGEPEVVIGAGTGLSRVPAAEDRMPLLAGARRSGQPGEGQIVWARTLRVDHDRYLDDHRVDGLPVLPFAAAMELMFEAATAAAGRAPNALRSVRLLKGVSVSYDTGAELLVQADGAASDSTPLAITLSSATTGRLHYQALADLGAAPAPDAPEDLDGAPAFPMSMTDAYRDLLFHGPRFQGILAIPAIDTRGASAWLQPSSPAACLAEDHGPWLLDPVLVDCALQVQLLWTRLHWEVTLLPSELAAYTRLAPVPGGGAIRHELRVRPTSQPPLCRADHWFFAEDGRLVATLSDMVGVGARALNRLAVRA